MSLVQTLRAPKVRKNKNSLTRKNVKEVKVTAVEAEVQIQEDDVEEMIATMIN